MRATSKRRAEKSRNYRIIGMAIAVVLLVVVGTWAYSRLRSTAKTTAAVTPNPSANPSSSPDGHSVADAGPTHNTTPIPSPTQVSSAAHPVTSTLAAPTGNVLSDPSVNCSSQSTCYEEASECDSVPGASCYIEATMSTDDVKIKAESSTDNDGDITIYWNPDQLSNGTWMVEDVASHDGSVATSPEYDLQVTN